MSWVKLPDEWMDSPEVLEAGPLATCVFLWSLSYSAQHLTDGHISRASLRGCSLVASRSQRSRVTRRLVATGFWVEVGDGFDIIDWERFLRKRAEVLEERAAATVRKQRQRERETKRMSHRDTRDRHGPPDPTRTPLGVRGRGGSNEDGPNGVAPNPALDSVGDSVSPPAGAQDHPCEFCGKPRGVDGGVLSLDGRNHRCCGECSELRLDVLRERLAARRTGWASVPCDGCGGPRGIDAVEYEGGTILCPDCAKREDQTEDLPAITGLGPNGSVGSGQDAAADIDFGATA